MDLSVIEKFEEQKVGTLKLSEAIRIGAKMTPRCRLKLVEGRATCAIGAAYLGATGLLPTHYADVSNSGLFPELFHPGSCGLSSFGFTIASISDEQSREEAADYAESEGL